MAGNLKGLSGIKGLVLRHGEKVAIALVGLAALWLMYKSASLPKLEDKYQASELHKLISQTTNAVQSATWPDPNSEAANEVYAAKPIDAKADTQVDPKLYQPQLPHGLDAPVVAATAPREDPQLLNAVEVRATGDCGLLAFLDPKIRREQELRMAAEAEELAKKQAADAAKAAQEGGPGGPGESGRRNRGYNGVGPEGMMANTPLDPKHPKRRAIEGMTRPLGVPLQGGERIEQAYWACVVAKVPIREQLKLYQDAFVDSKTGFDIARDMPNYKGFFVQRAEVVPGQEIKEADWKPVPVYDGQHQSIVANKPLHPSAMATSVMSKLYAAAASYWAEMSPDVINEHYMDFVLTSPLPPLVGRDWGQEASHPDFPTLANTPQFEQELAPAPGTPAATPEKPAATDINSTFSAAQPGTAAPGMMPGQGGEYGAAGRYGPGMGASRMGEYGGAGRYGPGGGMGMMGMGSMGRYSSEGGGPGGYGGAGGYGGYGGGYGGAGGYGGYGSYGREGGAASYGGMPTAGTPRTSLPKGLDFLLLRFFDYTVEPGKKYRYRVALVLADPNSAMPDSVLSPAVLDRRKRESQEAKAKNGARPDFRRVEGWSEPSPVVGIPLAGGAKLVEVKAPAADKIGDEPAVTLLVNSFDQDSEGNAIQTAIERSNMHRGEVANFVEDAEYFVATPPSIDTHPGFKFSTGITLVDAEGGEKIGKDLAMPGRALLMGPSGNLYVRKELDDKQAVETHKMMFFKSKFPPGAYGPQGAGPGYGGRPPGRGGRGG